jgi:hypothetical protein
MMSAVITHMNTLLHNLNALYPNTVWPVTYIYNMSKDQTI